MFVPVTLPELDDGRHPSSSVSSEPKRIVGRPAAYAAILALIIASIIIAKTILLAWAGYFSLPFTDHWVILEFVKSSYDSHAIDWAGLWSQENEHRIVWNRLIFLLDAVLFHGLNYFPLLFNWLAMTATTCGFCYVIVAQRRLAWPFKATMVALFAGCAFSATQIEVIIFPTGAGNLSVIVLTAAALISLAVLNGRHLFTGEGAPPRWSLPGFLAPAVFALMATLAFANGMFVWPAGLVLGWAVRWPRHVLVLWGVLGLTAAGLYMVGYASPGDRASPLHSLHQPVSLLLYLLLFLGGPFALLGKAASMVIGAGVAVTTFAAAVRGCRMLRYNRLAALMVAFGLFLLLTAGTTAVGRLSFGLEQAQASRYCTPVLYLIAAAVTLLMIPREQSVAAVHPQHSGRLVSGASPFSRGDAILPRLIAPLAILVSLLAVERSGNWAGAQADAIHQTGIMLVLHIDDKEREALGGAPRGFVDQQLNFLADHDLSIFREAKRVGLGRNVATAFRQVGPDRCVGSFDRALPVGADARPGYRVSGWAWLYTAEGRAARAPRDVALATDEGTIVGWGATGYSRPDVARAMSAVAKAPVGFSGYADKPPAGSGLRAFALDLAAGTACPIPGDPKLGR